MARWQYQAKAQPIISPVPETVTMDKWNMDRPNQIAGKKFITAVFAASLFFVSVVSAPSETITIDKWDSGQSRPRFEIIKKQYSYPSSFLDPLPLVSGESWYDQEKPPIYDRERTQYQYPYCQIPLIQLI